MIRREHIEAVQFRRKLLRFKEPAVIGAATRISQELEQGLQRPAPPHRLNPQGSPALFFLLHLMARLGV